MFAALAHDTRLSIYRLLVEVGPEGLAAGHIADKIGVSASSLTFHVAHLERCGLVTMRRAGRSVIYSADFGAMVALVDFLSQKCCGGHPEVCRAASGKTGQAS